MKQKVMDMTGKEVGEVLLPDAVFSSAPNRALLYENVKMLLANQRAGTHASRNTALMSGTTAKMYRQKGTGRARHGSMKRNIFVGGSVAFGPHPRDYTYHLPKKARRGGLRAALSVKQAQGKLVVVDRLELPEIKTKKMAEILSAIGVRDALIVVDGANGNVTKSVRNLPCVKLLPSEGLNVVDILRHEHVVITLSALSKVGEVLKS